MASILTAIPRRQELPECEGLLCVHGFNVTNMLPWGQSLNVRIYGR